MNYTMVSGDWIAMTEQSGERLTQPHQHKWRCIDTPEIPKLRSTFGY